MHIEPTSIAGFEVLVNEVYPDQRGYFTELFRRDRLHEATGFDFDTAQLNASLSNAGTLRGFHYKVTPPGQAKLVSVLTGSIYDVALDLRLASPTFGEWHAVQLTAGEGRSLLLQSGLAHAFLTLQPGTVIAYLNDTPYQPELEHALQPHSAGVNWQEVAKQAGVAELLVSERDLNAPSLAQTLARIAASR